MPRSPATARAPVTAPSALVAPVVAAPVGSSRVSHQRRLRWRRRRRLGHPHVLCRCRLVPVARISTDRCGRGWWRRGRGQRWRHRDSGWDGRFSRPERVRRRRRWSRRPCRDRWRPRHAHDARRGGHESGTEWLPGLVRWSARGRRCRRGLQRVRGQRRRWGRRRWWHLRRPWRRRGRFHLGITDRQRSRGWRRWRRVLRGARGRARRLCVLTAADGRRRRAGGHDHDTAGAGDHHRRCERHHRLDRRADRHCQSQRVADHRLPLRDLPGAGGRRERPLRPAARCRQLALTGERDPQRSLTRNGLHRDPQRNEHRRIDARRADHLQDERGRRACRHRSEARAPSPPRLSEGEARTAAGDTHAPPLSERIADVHLPAGVDRTPLARQLRRDRAGATAGVAVCLLRSGAGR